MNLIALIFVLFSCDLHAGISVRPKEHSKTVRPGDMVEAYISSDNPAHTASIIKEALANLGSTKKALFVNIKEEVSSAGNKALCARVVFGPEFNPDEKLSVRFNDEAEELVFAGWLWNPQLGDVPKEFDYEQIPLLSRAWWRKNWHWLVGVFLLVTLLGTPALSAVIKKRKQRKNIKLKKEMWLKVVAEAKSRDNISDIWRARDEIKALFPENQEEQRAFFDKLNQYQFKPLMSDSELLEVIKAKEEFLSKIVGRQRGV